MSRATTVKVPLRPDREPVLARINVGHEGSAGRGCRTYCGSKNAIAIANRKSVATTAVTAPAIILALSRLA